MLKITQPLRYTAALTLFVSALAFAHPSYAAATDTDDQTTQDQDNAPTPPPPPGPAPKHMAGHKPMMGAAEVETRIKTLHDKLEITPDQEKDWSAVAQAMRDNEAKIHQLIHDRHENPDNMTAVDDLQSYQQITQAHADGLQKLTTAFGTLYNEMSDDQKQNADMVFGKYEGHRDMPAKKHS